MNKNTHFNKKKENLTNDKTSSDQFSHDCSPLIENISQSKSYQSISESIIYKENENITNTGIFFSLLQRIKNIFMYSKQDIVNKPDILSSQEECSTETCNINNIPSKTMYCINECNLNNICSNMQYLCSLRKACQNKNLKIIKIFKRTLRPNFVHLNIILQSIKNQIVPHKHVIVVRLLETDMLHRLYRAYLDSLLNVDKTLIIDDIFISNNTLRLHMSLMYQQQIVLASFKARFIYYNVQDCCV